MNKKEQEVLQSLLKLYKDIYHSKDLFNKAYFKYTPEEAEKVFNVLLSKKESVTKKASNPISESIQSIKTVDEVEKFYLDNLSYNYDENLKDENLNKLSLNELKHLYGILFSSPLRANVRKIDLLDMIGNYFESINRARSMKP